MCVWNVSVTPVWARCVTPAFSPSHPRGHLCAGLWGPNGNLLSREVPSAALEPTASCGLLLLPRHSSLLRQTIVGPRGLYEPWLFHLNLCVWSSYPAKYIWSGQQNSGDTEEPTHHVSPGPGAPRLRRVHPVPYATHQRGARTPEATRTPQCHCMKVPQVPCLQGRETTASVMSLSGLSGVGSGVHSVHISQSDQLSQRRLCICWGPSCVSPWLCDFPQAACPLCSLVSIVAA